MERRQHRRYVQRLSISYTWMGQRLATMTEDISASGAQLFTNLAVPKRQKIDVTLVLPPPADKILRFQAKVAWSDQGRMGLSFEGMNLADFAVLTDYLAIQNSPRR